MKFQFNFIGVFCIFLGTVWLLENLGIFNFSFWSFISTWWPAILIFLGINFLIEKNEKPKVIVTNNNRD